MGEERRIVTVLFADVVDSTALVEGLDPEVARGLLGRYYTIAREVIEAHDGTLEKFIGDAVVAVYGLPRAHGDDAERALASALEFRDRVSADGVLSGQLAIRIGVNTGEVVADPDGAADDFLITGDAVNVAARLQQTAEQRTILVGERTVRAAGAAFTFGPHVSVEAKGKALPVAARTLLAHASGQPRRTTPLVGRQTDLAQLELAARRAFGEARPHLLTVLAPPGTGKTRLLEEFLVRLPAFAPGARVAVAACLPYGERLTYWPMRSVLLAIVGVGPDEAPDTMLAAIADRLRAGGVDDVEHATSILAATVGVGEAEGADREAVFAAWRTLVELASAAAPFVLVFEDLHWAGDSLLELVEGLVRPRGGAPVLTIATARPELLDRRPAWGGGRRDFISLTLEPLPDRDMSTMVGHLLKAPSPELVREVVARAEGNPFFAGEIVRSVLERVADTADTLAVGAALAMLPDTVHATLLARLDLLPGRERRVLQLGAVFGGTFRAEGVAALASGAPDDVEALADAAVGRDLLRLEPDGYSFRHALIREVAYGTLPRSERARLHAAAARWLADDTAGTGPVVELIAYHWRAAALLAAQAPADQAQLAELRRTAVEWLVRAADAATSAAASLETVSYLASALELAEPERLPSIHERLGDVQLGGEMSVSAYRSALELGRAAGASPDDELRVLARLMTVYTRSQGSVASRPSVNEMKELRARGEALLPEVSAGSNRAAFLVAQAFLPFWDSAFTSPDERERARQSARRGLALAEQADDADLQSAALDALSMVAQVGGRWVEVREQALRRLDIKDRLNVVERLDASAVVTWASALMGDLRAADEASRAGLSLVRTGQAPSFALHVLAWRMYALCLLGEWDEVGLLERRAIEFWELAERPPGAFALRGFLSALDVARARREDGAAQRLRDVLATIIGGYPDDERIQQMSAYLAPDVPALTRYIDDVFDPTRSAEVAPTGHPGLVRAEYSERVVSLLCDHGVTPRGDTLLAIVDAARSRRFGVLEAQAERALGIVERSPDALGRALERLDAAGAVPYAARVRYELAALRDDAAGREAAAATLERIGDRDQLERYRQSAAV